jgi:uncharacterized protein YqiB (DUF1249 family)
MSSLFENNFAKMVKLGIITQDGMPTFKEAKKMKSGGFMDLNLDYLANTQEGIVISMAHNFIQEGDIMADPDMEIRIVPQMKMVEALSYQQDAMGICQNVYTEDGKGYRPRLKNELNSFLGQWLNNLVAQGFGKEAGI